MSDSPRTIRRDTRVFISAVTRELGSVRKLVKKALEDNDYHAVEQDNFPPDYRDLKAKLRERIKSCDAVIHIAGQCFGAEPAERPADAQRRSYTQLEYDIAIELGKPVYVFLTGADFPADPHDPEAPELRDLQAAHRERLTSTGRDYARTTSTEQLDQKIRSLQLKVEKLTEEIQQVDQKMDVHGGRLRRSLAGVAVLVIAGLAVLAYLGWQQQLERRAHQQEQTRQQAEREKQQAERDNQERERIAAEAARKEVETIHQVRQEFAEQFLQQLLTNKEITVEDARDRALKELPALVKLPLAEIQSLIDRKIAPRASEKSLSSLDRARAALAQGNYDEVFQAADDHNQQGRELAMLEGTAALARFRQSPKPEWNTRALAAFQRAVALANPDSPTEWQAWTNAAASAASVLSDLARYAEAEPLRQYRDQGKPAVYFLKPDEPIAPHLDELLRPTADGLLDQGLLASRRGAHAEAIVSYEAALELMPDQPAQALTRFRARMNRAAALRELGLIAQASDDLVRLLPELDQPSAVDATMKGRARYHLGLCHWHVGDRAKAQRSAHESLAAYDAAPKANPVDPALRRQSEELLAAVTAGKAPPPLAKIDAEAALEAARARYRAREALSKLPLNQDAARLLDQVLGPARPTQEVFDALDRYYREHGKPAVWFLPLEEPIAPHLDQLPGPARTVKDVMDSLDRQYREQGKPAIWFLPLDQPIAPHLDELLGKRPK